MWRREYYCKWKFVIAYGASLAPQQLPVSLRHRLLTQEQPGTKYTVFHDI